MPIKKKRPYKFFFLSFGKNLEKSSDNQKRKYILDILSMKLAQRRIQHNELIYKFISFNSICLLNTYRKIWTSILSKIWRYRWCCIFVEDNNLYVNQKRPYNFFSFLSERISKSHRKIKKKEKRKNKRSTEILNFTDLHRAVQLSVSNFPLPFPSYAITNPRFPSSLGWKCQTNSNERVPIPRKQPVVRRGNRTGAQSWAAGDRDLAYAPGIRVKRATESVK